MSQNLAEHNRQWTVICPHCDHKHDPSLGEIYHVGMTHEFECRECGEKMLLTVEREGDRKYFSTKQIIEEEGSEVMP